MSIVSVTSNNAVWWANLCNELWPHDSVEEMLQAFHNGKYNNEYLYEIDGIYAGFISLSIRNDYVEGKVDSNPVGYIEGIYVKPEYRKKGIAKELAEFSERWAADRSCSMLASDCELTNNESRRFHNSIGFVEASINVHFIKRLK